MLHGESEGAHRTSIQCLSQLILKPEDGDKHEADQTSVHVEPWEQHLFEARGILSEQPDIWIQTIYGLLDSKDQGEETLSASCLSCLVKIDSVRDKILKNNRLSRFIQQLIHFLDGEKLHTQANAASSLESMSACLKDVISLDRSLTLDNLMRMIEPQSSKPKRAGVVCLSEYFVNDGEMRKLILQRERSSLQTPLSRKR
ncbi:hypothetical protein IW262DRAFT_146555 [Armillaria fumosa]|nr:hypothetical protein IW262DRAFT_146555 [Armillaria fumosa]